MTWRIGVDIGGTFTDLCAHDATTGAVRTLKVLSRPDAPGADVAAAIAALAERHGADLGTVGRFTHGTTVGVNTIIQRRGARLALFATAGFTDVLELARLRMPDAYSLFGERPAPLIPKDRVFGIPGRLLADGTEAEPLVEAAIDAAIAGARAKGCEGIVVSLLHAWRNTAHEVAVVARIAAVAPEMFVFRSTEVWPAIREFERTSTAVLNGYVHPRVALYLDRLVAALAEAGVPARPLITRSNGGVMAARQGRRDCVGMLLSGTACGVMGAAFVAAEAGVHHAATLDVGGTSADVALLVDGQAQFAAGETVGGFPLFVPSVAVSSIGAGGGSIARVDAFGMLKVGPDSAGSMPGPACYGLGGTEATLTDAFAVRGVLGHGALGYGAVKPDLDAAQAAVGAVAQRLGRSVEDTAEAIGAVAVSAMYLEFSKLFARNAVDLSELVLIAFGGAGPMVGCAVARELGIPRVLVPRAPGVVCALGGLVAEIRNDLVRTVMLPLDDDAVAPVADGFAALEAAAHAWLAEVGESGAVGVIQRSADMRYRGQSYEVEVPLDAPDAPAMAAAFHERHRAVFDHADPAAPVEVVNLRVAIRAGAQTLVAPLPPPADGPPPVETIRIYEGGGWQDVPLYHRDQLAPGHEIAGPAVVAQEDATLLLPAGARASVEAHGHLMVEL
jgi:N-methylhydantoinase A